MELAVNENPLETPPHTPYYDKCVIQRILDVVRSHPVYDENLLEQILDVAAECEPSPPAPPSRFYETREAAQLHVKAFAARHGYALTIRRSDQVKVDYICTRRPNAKGHELTLDPEGNVQPKLRTDCPFRLQLRRRNREPRRRGNAGPPEESLPPVWYLRVAHGVHNHGPSRRIANSSRHQPDLDFSTCDGSMSCEATAIAKEKEPSPPLPPGPPPAPPPAFYDSQETGFKEINEFAFRHGYALTVRRSDQKKIDFWCSRWTDPAKCQIRKSKGTLCPFRLQMKRRREGSRKRKSSMATSDPLPTEGWELVIRNGEHNHDPIKALMPRRANRKAKPSNSDQPPGHLAGDEDHVVIGSVHTGSGA